MLFIALYAIFVIIFVVIIVTFCIIKTFIKDAVADVLNFIKPLLLLSTPLILWHTTIISSYSISLSFRSLNCGSPVVPYQSMSYYALSIASYGIGYSCIMLFRIVIGFPLFGTVTLYPSWSAMVLQRMIASIVLLIISCLSTSHHQLENNFQIQNCTVSHRPRVFLR